LCPGGLRIDGSSEAHEELVVLLVLLVQRLGLILGLERWGYNIEESNSLVSHNTARYGGACGGSEAYQGINIQNSMQGNNEGRRTIKTILRSPSQNQNLPKCLSVNRNHGEAKLKPNPKRITDPKCRSRDKTRSWSRICHI